MRLQKRGEKKAYVVEKKPPFFGLGASAAVAAAAAGAGAATVDSAALAAVVFAAVASAAELLKKKKHPISPSSCHFFFFFLRTLHQVPRQCSVHLRVKVSEVHSPLLFATYAEQPVSGRTPFYESAASGGWHPKAAPVWRAPSVAVCSMKSACCCSIYLTSLCLGRGSDGCRSIWRNWSGITMRATGRCLRSRRCLTIPTQVRVDGWMDGSVERLRLLTVGRWRTPSSTPPWIAQNLPKKRRQRREITRPLSKKTLAMLLEEAVIMTANGKSATSRLMESVSRRRSRCPSTRPRTSRC